MLYNCITMDYEKKLQKAGEILAKLKDELLYLLSDTENYQYCSSRMLLPWIEEETEYAIKKLQLQKADERKLINKVHETLGVYSQNIPLLNRNQCRKRYNNRVKRNRINN